MHHLCILMMAGPMLATVAARDLGPTVENIYPLGGQRGSSVDVAITGTLLANARKVEFDCQDLVWTKTLSSSWSNLTGVVAISRDAALGPHLLRVITLDGYSTTVIFNVGQFPGVREAEPNERPEQAQAVSSLPAEIYGRMQNVEDTDTYEIEARAGSWWSFDLRSIEYGSILECKMYLFDANGKRLAFSDDRDDFDETPRIEYRFPQDGKYYIKLDQYRGPRGNRGRNMPYVLRISALPRISYTFPLGASIGATTRMRISGVRLEDVKQVFLAEARNGEHFRMTYPYTIPIAIRPDPASGRDHARISGKIVSRLPESLDVDFQIPADARSGLWRLWVSGDSGLSDGISIEVSAAREHSEGNACGADWKKGDCVINGMLRAPGERDQYRFEAAAGEPLHVWTLSYQLGLPYLDTVLQLRDAAGKLLAENDDVAPGIASMGNSDSSLFYTPQADGPVFLTVQDRLDRGGPAYPYRLRIKSERPSFQLMTAADNPAVARGGTSEFKVQMAREEGFVGEVSVWIEGLPEGVEAPRGKFRADQLWEPGADGLEMVVPEIALPVRVPESLPAGVYSFRVLGVAAGDTGPHRRIVEAQSTLLIGPITASHNFTRRPLPSVSMAVYDPFAPGISAEVATLSLKQNDKTSLNLRTVDVPGSATLEVKDLPPGVRWQVARREGERVTITLEASSDAPLGSFPVSAEALVDGRWAGAPPVTLVIQPAAKVVRLSN